MIGFEISINGREPIVAASDYFVFADLAFGSALSHLAYREVGRRWQSLDKNGRYG